MNKNTLAAVLGVVFDSYNNTLYGFFAVMLAPLFFSPDLGFSPIIGSFTAFAAGFVGRPFGGMLLGFLGDRLGRRIALVISSLLATIPSFIIGLLPTYETVGVLAPFLLIICRLLQGITVGADYTGALIYVSEQKELKDKTTVICTSAAIGFFGGTLGVLVSLASSSSWFFTGNWRYAFISAGLLGVYILFMRWNMDESPCFDEVKRNNSLDPNPFLSSLRHDYKNILACIVLGGANFVPVYLGTVYLNLHLKDMLELSQHAILVDNLFVYCITGFMIIFCARFLRRFNELTLMKLCGLWLLILSIPAYVLAYKFISLASLVGLQVFLHTVNALQIACLAILMPKLFPTNRRYSGIAFSYTLGSALLGGMTPLFATWLEEHTQVAWGPGIYLFIVAALYLIAVWFVEQSNKR